MLPGKQERRRRLQAYKGEAEVEKKVCYSSGVYLPTSHLRCLSLFHTLNLDAVPHGESEATYDALLQGQKWADLQSELQANQRPERNLQPWSHDGELAPELPEATLSERSVVGANLETGLVEDVAEAHVAEEPDYEVIAGNMSQSEEPGSSDEEGLQSHDHLADVADDPQAPQVVSSVEVPRFGRWGIFHLGRKRPSAIVPFGGIECICPLHARNDRTGCKKLIRNMGPEVSDLNLAVQKAKYWAIQGLSVRRQWEHIFTIGVGPTPDADELERQIITAMLAEWEVLSDAAWYAQSGEATGALLVVI